MRLWWRFRIKAEHVGSMKGFYDNEGYRKIDCISYIMKLAEG
jgi:hypothetical protein